MLNVNIFLICRSWKRTHYLYSFAKKSVPLSDLCTNVDFNIPNWMITFVELQLVIPFHNFTTYLKSKPKLILHKYALIESATFKNTICQGPEPISISIKNHCKFTIHANCDIKVVKSWKRIARSSSKCDHWIWMLNSTFVPIFTKIRRGKDFLARIYSKKLKYLLVFKNNSKNNHQLWLLFFV